MSTCAYGFRIVGPTTQRRRLVDHAAAFAAYCAADARADVGKESYLSAFQFGAGFRALLESSGSCRGYASATWSAWLWFDIDRADDLQRALDDARRLASCLLERYQLDDDALLAFYSGSKGFHLGLPTALWTPEPSPDYHTTCRRLAEGLARQAGATLDCGVYDRVRPFRAPNSRHGKTALHKRRLTHDELIGLSLDAIQALAKEPAPFDLPKPPAPCERAIGDWQEATALVRQESEAIAVRRSATDGTPTLNRATLDFIINGATEGDRHRLLFSAAANLAEFACPPALAHALLSEAALDSGLSAQDVRRQIECGLKRVEPPAPPPNPSRLPPPTDLTAKLTALWSTPPPNAGDAWEPPGYVPTEADIAFPAEGGAP